MTHDAVPRREPPEGIRQRCELQVRGVVQGVGFRPFIYRLAQEEGLGGSIGNDTDGVTIEIEGPPERMASFRARLTTEAPPLARIDSVTARDASPKQEKSFRIIGSEVHGQVSTGIPADAATCADCLRELLDASDRRYRYPFLNCTNCGPRFTITRRIPYDRPQTSMAHFKMCPACQAEYDDPANRRFHAQPNACPLCGPRVWLLKADSGPPALDQAERESASDVHGLEQAAQGSNEEAHGSRHDLSHAIDTSGKPRVVASEGDSAVQQTIELLLSGNIVAIKGIGGFHLAIDATNETAVARLRRRKRRSGKPLAVMVRDQEAARALCELNAAEEELMITSARPIVLARARGSNGIAPSVAPGIPWLGIFLPYAPLQHLLFADARIRALVMTSANLSEEPIAIDNNEARTRLGKIADAFLLHDREILQRCDDSVLAVVDGAPQFFRRARGFVPLAIPLPFEVPPLLAVGGHLKSVFTLARGRVAYQSQHLGDLETSAGLDFFRESLDHLMHTFEIEPCAVVHDLHPGYLSTSWAQEWAAERNLPLLGVQHHHAHIAGCMAEHGLSSPVIGLSLDGTGYGTDGRIWGGEVLIARLDGFQRFAHLEYVPMPGGDAAVRKPWRMALGHLHAAGLDCEAPENLALVSAQLHEARILHRMIDRGLNAPLTSSLGRLYDAVAAVVLPRRDVDYEAQAAIELEGICIDEPYDSVADSGYAFDLRPGDWTHREPAILSPTPLWHAVVRDLRAGAAAPRIAARFHVAVADGFVRAALLARDATGISHVAMSGGCLHNRRLARLLRMRLETVGFEVFPAIKSSPGDGGLSYGQAAVAAARLRGAPFS